MLSALKKLFSFKPKEQPSFGSNLHWIEADDNPWGVRLLDCRPVSMVWTSTTTDPAIAQSFVDLRSANGQAHLVAEPLPEKVAGGFSMPVPELPPEGCVSMARQMEEKWDLFHYNNRLFVSRSWTGKLGYTASVHCDGTSLHVSDILAAEQHDNDQLLKDLHFILRSHGNRVIMPHPLPAEFASTEDSVAFKEALASHTFSRYGALGWFGTFADTIPLREIARAELAEWINQREKRNPPLVPSE